MTRQIDQNAWMSSLNVDYIYVCIVGVCRSSLYIYGFSQWHMNVFVYVNVFIYECSIDRTSIKMCKRPCIVAFPTELLISVTIDARQCVKLGASAIASLVS